MKIPKFFGKAFVLSLMLSPLALSIAFPSRAFADDSGDSGDSSESSDSDDSDDSDESEESEEEKYPAYKTALDYAESALEDAINAGASEEEIAALEENVDEARTAFLDACEEHGFNVSRSDTTDAYVVTDETGHVVYAAGDPVIFSKGLYTTSDTDFSLSAGESVFSVSRSYTSPASDSEEVARYGSFGRLWTTNIDSRIIVCSRSDAYIKNSIFPSLISKFDKGSVLEELQGYLSYVDGCIDEAENEDIYEGCLEVRRELEELIARQTVYYSFIERNQANCQIPPKTRYGEVSKMADMIGSDFIIYVGDDGSPVLCKIEDDGIYRPESPSARKRIFVEKNEGGFVLNDISGEKRMFDGCGVLSAIEKTDGSTVIFSSDSDGLVTRVTLRSVLGGERSFSVTRSGGFVTSITDGSRTVKYSYADKMLSSVTDSDGDVRKFEYDGDLLQKLIKADGSFVSIVYETTFVQLEPPKGECEECDDEDEDDDGDDDDSSVILKPFHKVVATVDENGFAEKFFYDELNKTTEHIDHDGISTVYSYDENGNTLSQKNADGEKFTFSYDGESNLVSSSGPILSSSFEYDENGNVIRVSYSDGGEEKFTYSGTKMTAKTDRDGVTKNFEYDDSGKLRAIYSGGMKSSELSYENGLLRSSTDSFGNVTKYEYDEFSDIVKKSVFAKGKTSPSSVRTWKYDSAGRISKIIDESGIVYDYAYLPHETVIVSSDKKKVSVVFSPRKCILKRTVTDLLTNESRTTHYGYDKARRLVSVSVSGVDSEGRSVPETLVTSYSYTAQGRLVRQTDWNAISNANPTEENGWGCEYAFSSGEISRIEKGRIDNDGNIVADGKISAVFSSSLSGGSRIKKSVYGDGRNVISEFDSFGRLVSESINGRTVMKNEYSPAGRLLSSDVLGQGKFEFEYDSRSGLLSGLREVGGTKSSFDRNEYYPCGKKKSHTDRLGMKTEYSYDEFGNISEIRNSERIIETKRDALGRILLSTVKSPSGKAVFSEAFEYKDGGRKVERHVSGEKVGSVLRNVFGEIVSVTDGEGNVTSFRYDVFGRCVSEKDAYGNVKKYEYNARNQLVKESFADGSFKKYFYDAQGNCIRVCDDAGDVFRGEYDSRSRIVSSDSRPFSSPEKYSYDEIGRIVSVTKNGVVLEKFDYSLDGKQVVRTDSAGRKTSFRFDGFGRLLSETDRLGFSSSHEFDFEGNLVSETDFEGHSRRIERGCGINGENHYVRTTFHDGTFSYAEYDAASRIVLAKNSSGEIQYEYDAFGNLSSLYDVASGTRVKYSHDKNGNVTRVKSFGGIERDISYSYGKLGETVRIVDSVKTDSVPIVTEIDFSYDKRGREVRRHFSTGESVFSSYDNAGRLSLRAGYDSSLVRVFLAGYVYDDDGHVSLSVDSDMNVTRFTYDSFGRISEVSYPYSDSLKNHFSSLIEESSGFSGAENISVSRLSLRSEEFDALQNLCSPLGSVNAFQNVLSESFAYDTEGNMTSRKTPLGPLVYAYDDENRLVSVGSGSSCSSSGVSIAYDRNGNMTRKITANSKASFEYTCGNRMCRAIVSDSSGSFSDVRYGYDFFGRRNMTGGNLTVYDGFSLRELYSKDVQGIDEGVCQSFSSQSKNSSSSTVETNGRYVFIDDESCDDNCGNGICANPSRGVAVDFSTAPLYTGENAPASFVSLGGCESYSDSPSCRNILMSDLCGSVRTRLGGFGSVSCISYDTFGSRLDSDAGCVYSFIGKRFDRTAGTYDFGYRDYLSSSSRFTTSDPVKDGRNWYLYCASNPIDFFDADGYELAKNNSGSEHANSNGDTEYWMQSAPWGSAHLGGCPFVDSNGETHEYTVSTAGCTVTAVAEAISNLTGLDVTPDMINSDPQFFGSGDHRDEINFAQIAETFGVSLDYSGKGSDNIQSFINSKVNDDENEYAIILMTHIGENGTMSHSVVVTGEARSGNDGKTTTASVTATSRNDYNMSAAHRGEQGFANDNGNLSVTVHSNDYAYSLGCSN